jgi:putative FmdB family regulatory protein
VPLYEYECRKDGRFEQIRKFSDPPLTHCPTCGQPVEKLLSSPAIQFKGSGWYITDYARKGNGSSSGEGKEGGKDAAKGSGSDAGKDSGSSASSSKTESSSSPASSSKPAASSGSSSKP